MEGAPVEPDRATLISRWRDAHPAEKRFVLGDYVELEPKLFDLATGDEYFAVTPPKIRQAADTANTLWLAGQPEQQIYEYLAVVDQIFRDRFGAPARADEPALRPIIRHLMEADGARSRSSAPAVKGSQPEFASNPQAEKFAEETPPGSPAPPPSSAVRPDADRTDPSSLIETLRAAVGRRGQVESQLNEVDRGAGALGDFERSIAEMHSQLDAVTRPYLQTMRALYGRSARSAMAEYDALVLELGAPAAHEAVRARPARLAPLAAANANGLLGIKEHRQVREHVTRLGEQYSTLHSARANYDRQLAEGSVQLGTTTLPASLKELREMCSGRGRRISESRAMLLARLTTPSSETSHHHIGRLFQSLPPDSQALVLREMPGLTALTRGPTRSRVQQDGPVSPPNRAL